MEFKMIVVLLFVEIKQLFCCQPVCVCGVCVCGVCVPDIQAFLKLYNRMRCRFDKRLLCLHLPFDTVNLIAIWKRTTLLSMLAFLFMLEYLPVTSFSNSKTNPRMPVSLPSMMSDINCLRHKKTELHFFASPVYLSQATQLLNKQSSKKASKSCLHSTVTAVLHW